MQIENSFINAYENIKISCHIATTDFCLVDPEKGKTLRNKKIGTKFTSFMTSIIIFSYHQNPTNTRTKQKLLNRQITILVSEIK